MKTKSATPTTAVSKVADSKADREKMGRKRGNLRSVVVRASERAAKSRPFLQL